MKDLPTWSQMDRARHVLITIADDERLELTRNAREALVRACRVLAAVQHDRQLFPLPLEERSTD